MISPKAKSKNSGFTEAKRRLDELHNGKVAGIDAGEAFRAARDNLPR
jgi:hypothetical protein